jgi:hypothetical protein
LAAQYFTMSSMIPMALAARDANGPALIVLTRTPKRRPASYASVRVSLSSAAFADDIPPPYPGMARSLAMYVSDTNAPCGRMRGASRCTRLTIEYALTPTAARYPARLVSSSEFFTSGPLASECTTISSGAAPKSAPMRWVRPSIEKSPTSL